MRKAYVSILALLFAITLVGCGATSEKGNEVAVNTVNNTNKREEKHNRLMFKGGYIENDYVFKWPNGDPIKPDYVSGHFNSILKKNNLPHIRFHELRHSCASMLLNSGFTLKDVQEYMGHADIQMTANIYGHMDPSRRIALTANLAHNIFSEKNNAAEREVISV